MEFDEKTPNKIYNEIIPDVLVKGGDYNLEEIVGRDLVEKNGGQVVLIKYREGYSSTKIINRITSGAVEGER